MECLKLITANSFTEKRIGYLGLTQLFNEKSEVLMMATNRIRIDLNNQSNYIVSLALMALSEICTAEMCRDLASEVLKLLQQGTIDPTKQGTSYIKKKAALASTRIVKKVPEKLDDFVEKVELLMEDRHHGVLIATLQLC
jgi:AP-1 complex subunit gamma-1